MSPAALLWNVTSTIECELGEGRSVLSPTSIPFAVAIESSQCRDFTGLRNYSACSLYFISSFIEHSSTSTLNVQGMDYMRQILVEYIDRPPSLPKSVKMNFLKLCILGSMQPEAGNILFLILFRFNFMANMPFSLWTIIHGMHFSTY